MDNSYPKGGHVKLQREFKDTVLSDNRFACASWYSMNGQNDEFSNGHKLSQDNYCMCSSNYLVGQPTVHKESQPVPGNKLKATS